MAKAKPVVIQMNSLHFFGPLFVRGSRSHLATAPLPASALRTAPSEKHMRLAALSRRVGHGAVFAHGLFAASARAHLWESQCCPTSMRPLWLVARVPQDEDCLLRRHEAHRRLPVSPDFRRPSAYRARYGVCLDHFAASASTSQFSLLSSEE